MWTTTYLRTRNSMIMISKVNTTIKETISNIRRINLIIMFNSIIKIIH